MTTPAGNIHRLRRPRLQSEPSAERAASRRFPHVITIASGKGGVGKTNLSTNLAYNLGRLRRRVLLLDADLGLANVDVILGLSPEYNISHVLNGEKEMSEILVEGPGKMKILPASSGVNEITNLEDGQKIRLLEQLEAIQSEFDFILIDTAAGIADNVIYFALAAQTLAVIVTPEPTSMTDAYALIKVLATRYRQQRFQIWVNEAQNEAEAMGVFKKLLAVTDRFLNVSLDFLGYVVHDKRLQEAVRLQRLFSEAFPQASAARNFEAVARRISEMPHDVMSGDLGLLWRNLLGSEAVG